MVELVVQLRAEDYSRAQLNWTAKAQAVSTLLLRKCRLLGDNRITAQFVVVPPDTLGNCRFALVLQGLTESNKSRAVWLNNMLRDGVTTLVWLYKMEKKDPEITKIFRDRYCIRMLEFDIDIEVEAMK
jgi:hypothetical protein